MSLILFENPFSFSFSMILTTWVKVKVINCRKTSRRIDKATEFLPGKTGLIVFTMNWIALTKYQQQQE